MNEHLDAIGVALLAGLFKAMEWVVGRRGRRLLNETTALDLYQRAIGMLTQAQESLDICRAEREEDRRELQAMRSELQAVKEKLTEAGT